MHNRVYVFHRTMPDRDQFLFICPDCSTVTFENVDECPACGSEGACLTLGFEASGGGDDFADEFDNHDLVETEAASMYDHEVVDNFERNSWDNPVRKVLAEEIVERFAATLSDD